MAQGKDYGNLAQGHREYIWINREEWLWNDEMRKVVGEKRCCFRKWERRKAVEEALL